MTDDWMFWSLWLVGLCAGIGIGAAFTYLWLTRPRDSVEEFECARRALAEPRVLR